MLNCNWRLRPREKASNIPTPLSLYFSPVFLIFSSFFLSFLSPAKEFHVELSLAWSRGIFSSREKMQFSKEFREDAGQDVFSYHSSTPSKNEKHLDAHRERMQELLVKQTNDYRSGIVNEYGKDDVRWIRDEIVGIIAARWIERVFV